MIDITVPRSKKRLREMIMSAVDTEHVARGECFEIEIPGTGKKFMVQAYLTQEVQAHQWYQGKNDRVPRLVINVPKIRGKLTKQLVPQRQDLERRTVNIPIQNFIMDVMPSVDPMRLPKNWSKLLHTNHINRRVIQDTINIWQPDYHFLRIDWWMNKWKPVGIYTTLKEPDTWGDVVPQIFYEPSDPNYETLQFLKQSRRDDANIELIAMLHELAAQQDMYLLTQYGTGWFPIPPQKNRQASPDEFEYKRVLDYINLPSSLLNFLKLYKLENNRIDWIQYNATQ